MKKVLYVEDSVTAQLIMRKNLKELCELTIVSTLPVARTTLAEQTFDLVITDFIFPEGDAMELINRARRAHSPQVLPIIVVSGSMDRLLMSRVLRAGANEALSKPLNPVEFRTLLELMLREPYMRTEKTTLSEAICFQWQAQGKFFQYCADINASVSGETKAEASERMLIVIHEHTARGVEIGHVSHGSLFTHFIRS